MIRCGRIWTAEDGNSSFEEGVIDRPKGERGGVLSGTFPATGISFRETGAGGAFEWHDAPARQFVMTLSGALDFQTRAGAHFILRPGDTLLAEDTTGTGCGFAGRRFRGVPGRSGSGAVALGSGQRPPAALVQPAP